MFSNVRYTHFFLQFSAVKNKDYDLNHLFNDEQELIIACWVFLIHIVWNLEDATLRNYLSFHLDNSSQLFIKTFLEHVQEENDVGKGAVFRSLNYACGEKFEVFVSYRFSGLESITSLFSRKMCSFGTFYWRICFWLTSQFYSK